MIDWNECEMRFLRQMGLPLPLHNHDLGARIHARLERILSVRVRPVRPLPVELAAVGPLAFL